MAYKLHRYGGIHPPQMKTKEETTPGCIYDDTSMVKERSEDGKLLWICKECGWHHKAKEIVVNQSKRKTQQKKAAIGDISKALPPFLL